MSSPIRSILIVGGGTAGWLTAAILAAKHRRPDGTGIQIQLVEAPDIPIIGVGEGTWPSMRTTLRSAGIKEADFLRECHASFKQASKFVGWKNGDPKDFYYHPFDLPENFYDANLAQYWVDKELEKSFSLSCCPQEQICENDLSPKLITTPEYAGVSNYGYHLDAGKFSQFLKKHCTEKLVVSLVLDKVIGINSHENGDIASVETEKSGQLAADLFVDCTGFKSMLLGQHFGIGFIDKSRELPINSALAVQVPYEDGAAIKSQTISTAQEAGWIWDIGLENRRGVGHVFSSNHISDDAASEQLRIYLGISREAMDALNPKKIAITPGYREEFWHKNCVAIGLSAGFLEPLEASAMMVIEASANMLADQMPANREAMEIISKRFNRRFHFRWERIIDFLKLHYVLSKRKEAFWRESANEATVSASLKEDLHLWKHQAPWKYEFDRFDEAFPAASYQYVLYGMGFQSEKRNFEMAPSELERLQLSIENVARNGMKLIPKLVSNRKILDLIKG